jgi:hypothetical protein
MVFFEDWLPSGHGLLPGAAVCPRADFSEHEELPVAVHRDVPGLKIHSPGLTCACAPIWRTIGEVVSSAFRYEVSTLNGGCH